MLKIALQVMLGGPEVAAYLGFRASAPGGQLQITLKHHPTTSTSAHSGDDSAGTRAPLK